MSSVARNFHQVVSYVPALPSRIFHCRHWWNALTGHRVAYIAEPQWIIAEIHRSLRVIHLSDRQRFPRFYLRGAPLGKWTCLFVRAVSSVMACPLAAGIVSLTFLIVVPLRLVSIGAVTRVVRRIFRQVADGGVTFHSVFRAVIACCSGRGWLGRREGKEPTMAATVLCHAPCRFLARARPSFGAPRLSRGSLFFLSLFVKMAHDLSRAYLRLGPKALVKGAPRVMLGGIYALKIDRFFLPPTEQKKETRGIFRRDRGLPIYAIFSRMPAEHSLWSGRIFRTILS